MAEMSDYLEVALLNATLNGVAFTAVNNPYVSLHTADPTDAGTGTEVSGGSYARTTASLLELEQKFLVVLMLELQLLLLLLQALQV
jgi:hypothetical protein